MDDEELDVVGGDDDFDANGLLQMLQTSPNPTVQQQQQRRRGRQQSVHWRLIGEFDSEAEMTAARLQLAVNMITGFNRLKIGQKKYYRCKAMKAKGGGGCPVKVYEFYPADRSEKMQLFQLGAHRSACMGRRSSNKETKMETSAIPDCLAYDRRSSSGKGAVLPIDDDNDDEMTDQPPTSLEEANEPVSTIAADDDRSSLMALVDDSSNGASNRCSLFALSDAAVTGRLLQLATSMQLAFTYSGLRSCEFRLAGNGMAKKGKTVLLEDMGEMVRVTEGDGGGEMVQWMKADVMQFVHAVRGRCHTVFESAF